MLIYTAIFPRSAADGFIDCRKNVGLLLFTGASARWEKRKVPFRLAPFSFFAFLIASFEDVSQGAGQRHGYRALEQGDEDTRYLPLVMGKSHLFCRTSKQAGFLQA